MPAINPPQSGGTASNYPTFKFIDAGGTKFGLSLATGNTGTSSAMGSAIALGTTTEALQGIILQPSSTTSNRWCALTLLLDGVALASWIPYSNSLGRAIHIPIAIAAGVAVTVQIAQNIGTANSVTIVPHPYQSQVTPTAASAVAVGDHSNTAAQGVTLAAGSPDSWGLIGALSADTDALLFSMGPGSKTTLRTTIGSYVDVGISTSAGTEPDSLLMDNIMVVSESTSLHMGDHGPFRFDGLLSGKKLWARAANVGGGLVDPISVQAVAFLKA